MKKLFPVSNIMFLTLAILLLNNFPRDKSDITYYGFVLAGLALIIPAYYAYKAEGLKPIGGIFKYARYYAFLVVSVLVFLFTLSKITTIFNFSQELISYAILIAGIGIVSSIIEFVRNS